VGRIKSVGICTMELHGDTLSLGIMYEVGTRQFLEEQLRIKRKARISLHGTQ